jgi:hypothetical protein
MNKTIIAMIKAQALEATNDEVQARYVNSICEQNGMDHALMLVFDEYGTFKFSCMDIDWERTYSHLCED